MCSRLTRCVTLAAKHRTSDLWMKWHLIVLSAVIADDVETLWRVVTISGRCFFGTTLSTTLRRHHIALVEHLLFLFSKQEDLFTLHTRNFYVRHR